MKALKNYEIIDHLLYLSLSNKTIPHLSNFFFLAALKNNIYLLNTHWRLDTLLTVICMLFYLIFKETGGTMLLFLLTDMKLRLIEI